MTMRPQGARPKESSVLAITQNAIDAVKQVAPGDAGLRIYMPEGDPGITSGPMRVEITEEPRVDDQVVESEGARVFLEPTAAAALENMTLDASSDGTRVRFTVTGQT
jgi:iron-sulfur cluster assembly protein